MTRPTMHIVVGVLGGALAVGALICAALILLPMAAMLGVWALILLVGLAIERWRYQRLLSHSPGPDWQRTDERFVDPETGRLVTVYFHPATGERRYVGG